MGVQQATANPAGHPRLRVTTHSGRVTVTAEERADFHFETRKPYIEDVVADSSGYQTPVLDRGSRDIDIRCPLGTDVVIGTKSGDVELSGEFGRVSVTTNSGRTRLDRADFVDLRSDSGDIEVAACGQQCRVSTGSGKAVIGPTGAAEVMTVSGSISLEGAAGGVRARSATGDVEVRTTGKNDVAVETLSGRVTVRVPHEVHPEAHLKSLSGKRQLDCEEGTDCCVAVRTMSGSIALVPD